MSSESETFKKIAVMLSAAKHLSPFLCSFELRLFNVTGNSKRFFALLRMTALFGVKAYQ